MYDVILRVSLVFSVRHTIYSAFPVRSFPEIKTRKLVLTIQISLDELRLIRTKSKCPDEFISSESDCICVSAEKKWLGHHFRQRFFTFTKSRH